MRADRRWIIYRDTTVLGHYTLATIPEVEAGCVAMELSETDDGVSDWYFHEEYGLIMEGAEPSDELHAPDLPDD